MSTPAPRVLLSAATLLLVTVVSACGAIPGDTNGTLDRVRSTGVMRVGAFQPEASIDDEGAVEAMGEERALLEAYADSLGADVEWAFGDEDVLMGKLESGEVDVVSGGLTAGSPWAERVTLTEPYMETTSPDGRPREHVVAVSPGSDAFVSDLGTFLGREATGK